MRSIDGSSPGAGGSRVSEWRPGGASILAWNLLAAPLGLGGLLLFIRLATLRSGSTQGHVVIRLWGVLLALAVTLVATALLLAAHEGIHALVMRLFGARPRFGALLVAGAMPALYTTAPGHRFRRRQYLAVAVAPGIAITALGAAACLSPAGGYLVVPLTIHLMGCVGDLAATWRVLREPAGTACEDLRDGVRFYRP